MNGRRVLTSILIVFSLLVVAEQAAGQKVRFGTAVDNPTYNLVFLAGKEKGFWKEADIDVEWVPFRAGAMLNRALAAGEVDLSMVGTTTALQGIVGGVPQIVVADVTNLYESNFWVRADSPIKEAKDLKGTRVSVTGLGGLMHAYARAVTKSLGLEKDVKFVAAGGVREQIALLKAGATEVNVNVFISMVPLKVKGEVREVLTVQDYLPKEWSEIALTARTAFAARSPREVGRAIKGYFKTTDFIQTNRDWAVDKMKSTMGYEEEVAKVIFPRLKYNREGMVNPKTLENIVNFLVEYGIAAKEKVPPLDKIYDKSFTG